MPTPFEDELQDLNPEKDDPFGSVSGFARAQAIKLTKIGVLEMYIRSRLEPQIMADLLQEEKLRLEEKIGKAVRKAETKAQKKFPTKKVRVNERWIPLAEIEQIRQEVTVAYNKEYSYQDQKDRKIKLEARIQEKLEAIADSLLRLSDLETTVSNMEGDLKDLSRRVD